jgi:hypothetical protein
MTIRLGTLRRALAAIIAVCWSAIFVATHLPRIPVAIDLPGIDKWEHAAAYAGLACLLTTYGSFGKPLSRKVAICVIAIGVVYGAVDELSQIPVGRDAEFSDWLADCLGTLIGVGSYVLLQKSLRSFLFSKVSEYDTASRDAERG